MLKTPQPVLSGGRSHRMTPDRPGSLAGFFVFYILTGRAAAAAKSLQSYPTLCDPIDGSPPGSPVPGILQARTLEWVAISFSNAWKWKVKAKSLSRVWLLATPWTAAYQAPPSMWFSRQEYWSGVPLPSPTGRAGISNQVFLCFWYCHCNRLRKGLKPSFLHFISWRKKIPAL